MSKILGISESHCWMLLLFFFCGKLLLGRSCDGMSNPWDKRIGGIEKNCINKEAQMILLLAVVMWYFGVVFVWFWCSSVNIEGECGLKDYFRWKREQRQLEKGVKFMNHVSALKEDDCRWKLSRKGEEDRSVEQFWKVYTFPWRAINRQRMLFVLKLGNLFLLHVV